MLQYGNPAWEHIERIRGDVNLHQWIAAGYFLPLLQMTPPCEMTTQQELLYLVERSKMVTPERLAVIQDIENNLEGVWSEYLNTLGVSVSAEEIKALMDKYEGIVDYLKIKFNRARPFQAAGYYNIPLYPRLRSDSYDSAYPSGHTFLALCVYHHYVTLHPELNKELMLMVLKIKQSREDGGVHYPSDGLFAFQVYHHLKDYIFHPGPYHPIVTHITVALPENIKRGKKKRSGYTDPNWITDRAPVSDYVEDKREDGQGVGAVAQGETKHLPNS